MPGSRGEEPDGGTGSTTPLRAARPAATSATKLLLSDASAATARGCELCTARWQRDGLAREHQGPSQSPPSPKRAAGSPQRRARGSACLAVGAGGDTQRYTPCEVALHGSELDCWFWAHRTVYDVTDFLHQHPGGYKSLLRRAGADASVDFDFHSAGARQLWAEFEVGALVSCAQAAGVAPALSCAIQ